MITYTIELRRSRLPIFGRYWVCILHRNGNVILSSEKYWNRQDAIDAVTNLVEGIRQDEVIYNFFTP